MNHAFIDRYSDGNSLLHRLDPRTKVLCALAFILLVVLTPPDHRLRFAGCAVLLLCAAIMSRIPLSYILRRSLVVVPFVAATAAFLPFMRGEHGVTLFWGACIKSWLGATAAIIVSATTPFTALLKGMERLGMPKIIILILSFMYRYVFVLLDEAISMDRARRSRSFGGGLAVRVRTYSHILASLFIRAYERGERVYQSMAARGFDGEIKTFSALRLALADYCVAAVFAAGLAGVCLL